MAGVTPKSYREALFEFESAYWNDLLEHTKGNVSWAAAIAGVNRTHAHEILARLHGPNPRRRKLRGNWGDLTH